MDIKDKAEYRVKRETAKLMKKRGYPISEILLMTGLPESEIEELQIRGSTASEASRLRNFFGKKLLDLETPLIFTPLEPDVPPYKVHTVFQPKNFRAAKAATQCSFIFASKMYCTASTHLCFGRCAVTGGLRYALRCSTLPAKYVNSRPTSQPEAKKVDPVVRTVEVPYAHSAVVRVAVPTAATYDAVRSIRTTLRIGNNTALLINTIV